MNSDLTKQIQSSIDDMCQCTLPCYTLRGSIDLCDPQSNCAIYTGRILGSDTASATQVFKMVEDWLAIQNGSLLNGTLTVDPDCPLRRLSPRDTPCSPVPTNSRSNDNKQPIEVIRMFAIGLGSGIAIIAFSLIICTCVCVIHKKIMKKKAAESTMLSSQDTHQRHYSVAIERNPSYNRHHSKVVGPIQKTIFNGGRLEAATAVSTMDTLNSESPYAYTSLKPTSRQADPPVVNQMTHLTVEQLTTMPPRLSQASNNEYVINGLLSPSPDGNDHIDNNDSTFHPIPVPTSNSRGVYLSIS